MSDDLTKAFGLVLRRHRKSKGWSQMKLAMESGMHLNALGNLERGQRNPSLQTIVILCKEIDTPVSKLLGEVEAEFDTAAGHRRHRPAKTKSA